MTPDGRRQGRRGGGSAVSDIVVQALRGFTACSVSRLAGATRYETAARIAQVYCGRPPGRLRATGPEPRRRPRRRPGRRAGRRPAARRAQLHASCDQARDRAAEAHDHRGARRNLDGECRRRRHGVRCRSMKPTPTPTTPSPADRPRRRFLRSPQASTAQIPRTGRGAGLLRPPLPVLRRRRSTRRRQRRSRLRDPAVARTNPAFRHQERVRCA